MQSRVLVLFIVTIALLVTACGGSSTPGTPTPPTPSRYVLGGSVRSNGAILAGARVLVVDGPSSGATATSDASGRYSIGNLSAGGFTVRASLDGYSDVSKGVTLTADTILDFDLIRIPRANLMGLGGTVSGAAQPDGTYDFPASGQNLGPDCATQITGTSTLTDASGATVATVDWSLPASTIVGANQSFVYHLCCVSRDVAFAASKFSTRFTFVAVACP